MAIVVLTSASGSPGVTTTTISLAIHWGSPAIAVDADPGGGSAMVAGFFQGMYTPEVSVVDLLMAHRAGRLYEQFPQSLAPIHSCSASIMPGPRSHAQAHSALDVWEPLSSIWRTLTVNGEGTDVLIDAGRLGMEYYPESLLKVCDLNLLVTKSDLPSLSAAKQWAERAQETHQVHPESPEWAILVVGPGRPYATRDITSVLGLPVISTLDVDSKGASAMSQGSMPRKRSPWYNQFTRCAGEIQAKITATHRVLTPKDER